MKEIDFLPEWYKSGRRRQLSYRTQYFALAGIFVVMLVWNSVAGHSLSKATAQLSEDTFRRAEVESASQEFSSVENEIMELREKAESIREIDSRIDVASVLGELSFLIGDNIVISKIVFSAEKFQDHRQKKSDADSAVRVANGKTIATAAPHLGDVRFHVLMTGVASEGGDVAQLICKLEDSSYFCRVIPSFSRNKKISYATGAGNAELQVSEFEITCYVANYKEVNGND
jgi:hypothetical protein